MTQQSLVAHYMPLPFSREKRDIFTTSQASSLPSVLVVDPSTLFRQAVKAVLEGVGYTVLAAATAEEGLRLATHRRPDACIVDFALPGLDGPHLVQRLRREPNLERMAVLMLSGTDDQDDEARAFDAGADDYIIKSDGFQVLRHRLKAQLRRRAHEDDLRRTLIEQHRHELDARESDAAREQEELRQAMLNVIARQGMQLQDLMVELPRLREQLAEQELRLQQNGAELAASAVQPPRTMASLGDDVLSDLSGELRTPVNAIIGFSELLAGELFGPLTQRQRDYLKQIKANGRQLRGVVDELQDLARLAAGRLALAMAPISLEVLVESVAGGLQPVAAERGVRVDLKMHGEVRVLADRPRMRQALHNLLSHAVTHAADQTHIQVVVAQEGERIEVRLTVESHAQPTNVGMTLARRLFEAHGGGVEIRGSSRIAYLPIV